MDTSEYGYYLTVYPGVYLDREKPLIEQYAALAKSLEARGPVNPAALIAGTLPEGTPGIGPVLPVTREKVLYDNLVFCPDNPLFLDTDYARQAGFLDVLALTAFGACDDAFMLQGPFKPSCDSTTVCGLNHAIASYGPICPGDTLYMVQDGLRFTDLTPREGSIFRTWALAFEGSVYNQRGEKVNSVVFRVRENHRFLKDPESKPADFAPRVSPPYAQRPQHRYTDADWETIMGIWQQETVRGSKPLFWEDVKLGDTPPWTLNGPSDAGNSPLPPYGTGAGAQRTLKREILDPALRKTLVRSETDGIYRLPNPTDGYLPRPAELEARPGPGGPPGGKSGRQVYINYYCRDLANRHIANWMGDQGWITSLRWGLDVPEVTAAYIHRFPENPEAEDFFAHIPLLQKCCSTAHGLTGDCVIIKSYVYDKRVVNGQFLVDLAWYAETLDGLYIEQGAATVRLPSRTL